MDNQTFLLSSGHPIDIFAMSLQDYSTDELIQSTLCKVYSDIIRKYLKSVSGMLSGSFPSHRLCRFLVHSTLTGLSMYGFLYLGPVINFLFL